MFLRIAATMLLLLAGCFQSISAPPPPYMDLYPTVTLGEFPVTGVPFTIEVDVTHGTPPLFSQYALAATNVMLDVQLPPELILISCTVASLQYANFAANSADLATVSTNGGIIHCQLGRIYREFHRKVFVTVRPTQPGTFIHTATVSGEGAYEAPSGNNYLVSSVQVHTNGLRVAGGVSVAEQSGQSARFQVQVTPHHSQAVTVDYFTADGTATAGQDYVPVSGTLVFPPAVSNLFVFVPVLDDQVDELERQSFTLQLTNAVNADISSFSEPNYVVDDEPAIQVSITNAPPILEGYLVTNLTFGVHFSGVSDVPIVFSYSATGALTGAGTYTNPPGVSDVLLTIPVVGNVTPESNRVVTVTLSNPYLLAFPWPSIELGQSTAEGVILDDDGGPGNFHHLEITAVPSPQIASRPFPVYVHAKDFYNNPATNYVSDWVEVDLYRLVNFSSTIIQTVYITNFVGGTGVAWLTSTNPQSRLNIVAWKPIGDRYTTAIAPEFRAIASPPLFLSLGVTAATEGDGVFVGAGRVSIPNIDVQDVVVQPASYDPVQLEVPLSVVIPAGQTSAVFDVRIVDDDLFDGTRPTIVTVNSPGYISASRIVTVLDNELVPLTVVLPEGLSEAKGLNTGTAFVQFDRPLDGGANLTLISSNTARLTVPGTIWVNGGQTSATFTVSVPDNSVIDGPQMVAVSASFSAAARGWASTLVQDNDTNITLIVNFANDIPIEGLGTRTNSLTVRLGGVTTNDVTVHLESSHPEKVAVVPSVTVPAGQLSVGAVLTVLNDQEPSGDTGVTLTGIAPGFLPGTNKFTVYDDDVHHFTLASIPSNQASGVPFPVGFMVRGPTNGLMTFFRGAVSLAAFSDGEPLPVTPSVVSNLLRGTWNGSVAVKGWGTNVQLLLTAPSGLVQTNSNPFAVIPPEWALQTRIKGMRREPSGMKVVFDSHTNGTYQLQAATSELIAPWISLGPTINGTGSETNLDGGSGLGSGQRFYRLKVRPQ